MPASRRAEESPRCPVLRQDLEDLLATALGFHPTSPLKNSEFEAAIAKALCSAVGQVGHRMEAYDPYARLDQYEGKEAALAICASWEERVTLPR